jgi:ATPase
MKIDIEAKTPVLGNNVDYQINESGSSILFIVNKREIGANVGIYVDNEFLFSSQIGKKDKIDKRSEYGKNFKRYFNINRNQVFKTN